MDWGIFLGVVGVVGLSLSMGVGVTMAATTTPGEFKLARWCFFITALLMMAAGAMLYLVPGLSLWARSGLAAVVGAVSLGGLVYALDWVAKKEEGVSPNKEPAVTRVDDSATALVAPPLTTLNKALPGPRAFTNRSARALIDAYQTPGLSRLQASKLVEPYIGLWFEDDISVINVLADTLPDHSYGYFHDPEKAEIECRFGPQWIKQVSRLRPGDKVRIRGRISSVTNTDLNLTECEIVS